MKIRFTFLHGILTAIVAPIIVLIIFIIFSNNNTFGLVENDYYQKELDYQSQINKKTRANKLENNVNIYNDNKYIFLQFPSIFSSEDINGEILLFRPSNPDKDTTVQIILDKHGLQNINMDGLQKGAWIIKIFWNNKEDGYYSEKRIFVNS